MAHLSKSNKRQHLQVHNPFGKAVTGSRMCIELGVSSCLVPRQADGGLQPVTEALTAVACACLNLASICFCEAIT